MGLSKQEVEAVARLARLELSDAAAEQMASRLSAVLNYVAKLNELDTNSVEPMSHPGAIVNVFRDDLPTGSLEREQALRNAPDQDNGCFRVPKVIE